MWDVALGRFGFGGAPIGNLYKAVDDEQAMDALAAAWERGIRYFDTAPHYGLGLSERRMGAFLEQHPRDEFVLSTKVGRLLVPNPDYAGGRDLRNQFDVPDDLMRHFDASEGGIRRSLEESLQRLGMDRVDILYLHDPEAYDLEWGLREGLPALAMLRAEGLVREIGIGVNDPAVATRAVREGVLDLVMIAGRYTLLEQPALSELLPTCEAYGVRVVNAAVFNSGLLATPNPSATSKYDYGPVPPMVLQRARALADACAEFDVELPAAALQYSLRHPAVGTVVVGTASPPEVRQNVDRMRAEIPEELWASLVERGLAPF